MSFAVRRSPDSKTYGLPSSVPAGGVCGAGGGAARPARPMIPVRPQSRVLQRERAPADLTDPTDPKDL